MYEPIEEFPEGMMEKFGSCSKINCKVKMAGKEVYHRFVVKKKSSQKYPGKMMEAMAWYEILFNGKHKDTDKFIKRYLENYPNDYKYKKVDEKFIRSLLNMNKGRKNMRKALGMDLEEKTDIEDEIEFRTYTRDQMQSQISDFGGFEMMETYDFRYDLANPVQLDDESEDAVYVLRRR